ncbi:hypothetical protein EJB05_01674, partial [Eragrostis curvula]
MRLAGSWVHPDVVLEGIADPETTKAAACKEGLALALTLSSRNSELLARMQVLLEVSEELALAEEDCHGDKELVKVQCRKTLEVLGPYVDPKPSCIRAVEQSDMACICRIITPEEEIYISIISLYYSTAIAGATLKITSMRVLQGKQSKEGSWK